jgi:hypothetical protein
MSKEKNSLKLLYLTAASKRYWIAFVDHVSKLATFRAKASIPRACASVTSMTACHGCIVPTYVKTRVSESQSKNKCNLATTYHVMSKNAL